MKRLFKTLLIVFAFLLFSSTVLAQEQIQNFDTQIVINKDGTIDVEEKIVYDFATLERHGIYRNIPYIKTNKDGKKFKLEFENFSVIDEVGKLIRFSKTINNQPSSAEASAGKQLAIKVGDPNRTVTGVRTYIIRYRVSGALTYFSDHDELYWNATGNEWTISNAAASTMVYLPDTIDQNKIQAVCYTGPSGSNEQNCNVENNGNAVEFKSNQTLNAYEGMTVAVSFPKDQVAVLEPKPYVTFWETIFGKITLALIILALILWYVVYPIWIPIKWLREGRDPSTSSGQAAGEVRAWFDPPKTKSGRPLTPEEAGALVDERADMEDVSGMIVSLAQKGYLKIEERKKGDFYFIKRSESSGNTNLLPFEEDFLREVFKTGDEYHLKKNKLYDAVEKVKTNLYLRLVAEGFFQENPNKIRTFYSIIGVVALTTGNIALAFSSLLFGRHMPKKTHIGVEAKNVAKSLKNFLSSQERRIEFLVKKADLPAGRQVFFEKLLPYAIAFGVEKIWAERFKDIAMQPPDWYSGYGSSTRFNSIYFTNSLNSSFSSLRSAATPVSSSTGHGSGFSGGSSGGGGGGGGGGSW